MLHAEAQSRTFALNGFCSKRNRSEKGVVTLYRLLSSKAQLAMHFTASISISAFL